MVSFWQNILYPLIAFNGTLTVISGFAAFSAFTLYYKQRRDRRRDAARVILREIEDAESLVADARANIEDIKTGKSISRVQIMKNDSWGTLQHVLAKVLPQDVMKSIGSFYEIARQIDEVLNFSYEAFYNNVGEVRANQYRVIANFLEDVARDQKPNPDNSAVIAKANKVVWDRYTSRKKIFEADYPTATSYLPTRPLEDAVKYLDKLSTDISQTRPGEMLRRAQKTLIQRVIETTKI